VVYKKCIEEFELVNEINNDYDYDYNNYDYAYLCVIKLSPNISQITSLKFDSKLHNL